MAEMTIAVHVRLYPDGRVRSRFVYDVFCYLAAQHPTDRFLFLFDQPFDASLLTLPNITGLELGPAHRNRLLKHYWFQYKLPRLLNRYRVDAVVNDDQTSSLRTRVPQFILLEDLPWLEEQATEPKYAAGYHRKYFPAFLNKARGIWVYSTWLQERLAQHYPVSTGKTTVLFPVSTHPSAQTETSVRRFQEEHTGGKDFFICPVNADTVGQVITVLKAFSVFKKWQQSGIRLLLLNDVEPNWQPPAFSTYKYRNEVTLLDARAADLPIACAAAYAGIYLPGSPVFDAAIWQTQSTSLNWIMRDWPFLQSLYADAALFTQGTEADLSEKMMRYYKDESIARNLQSTRQERLARASFPATAERIYSAIGQR
jgi:hypothetical protein